MELRDLIRMLDELSRRDAARGILRRLPQAVHYHQPGGPALLATDKVEKIVKEEGAL